jgi:hypothetical protein
MKQLVAFPLKDGSMLFVEVEEPEAVSGITRAGRRPGEVFTKAEENFEQAIDKIRASTQLAVSKLRDLAVKPDELEMEFGFNLSAQFGAVIAAATTEANYKVTLRWTGKAK